MKSTSLEALEKVTKTKKKHYKEIVRVLTELKTATAICIMNNSFLTQHQISRRTSELERMDVIKTDGKKFIENKNRSFTIYKIA